MRIHLDDSAIAPRSIARDLAAIERLIERCEQELEGAELNVKLADFVRLLEFRAKLQPTVDAEATFWRLIDEMRREELARDTSAPVAPSDREEDAR
ncbi:MAG TPA: hypothetical protein VNN55_00840 [bacterium]|nr:hypothetical protein [bacterium]